MNEVRKMLEMRLNGSKSANSDETTIHYQLPLFVSLGTSRCCF